MELVAQAATMTMIAAITQVARVAIASRSQAFVLAVPSSDHRQACNNWVALAFEGSCWQVADHMKGMQMKAGVTGALLIEKQPKMYL